jgi:DNA-binding transcriptional MerR regulator/methylmalonyl-CoA mutase cobalamin-binding subunit
MTASRSPTAVPSRPAAELVFVSIGGLSRATGVPIETLRSWEQRYGFPKSVRKPSGHRQFAVENVERIRRIASALDRGLRAGEVVPASDAVLDSLLSALPARPVSRGHGAPLDLKAFIGWVKRFDADRLMRSLQSDLAREDPLAYLETRIAPGLAAIGAAWEAGEIDIAHEHFASERIEDVVRGARLRFEETANGPLVVMATLPGEPHRLGLQMAALVLAARGLRVSILGTELPIAEIPAMAQSTHATAVGISVSSLTSRSAASFLPTLRSALPRKIELVVGGAGAPEGIKGVTRIADLRFLDGWTEGLLQRSRAS